MTAQAPYESQAREMLQRLESVQPPNVILQQLQILGDMAALLRCICAAASPDAAPVSAGGDAVAFRWQVGINANAPMSGWCTDMGTLEQVKRSSTPRIEYAYAATPAPPVGADWVMVPREATERMLNVGMGLYNDLSGEEGYFVTIKEQRDAFKRVWIAMLAAHAQAGEGSNG